MSKPIYLDYNATTPLSQVVKAELVRLLQLDLGNPSSRHWAGDQSVIAFARTTGEFSIQLNSSGWISEMTKNRPSSDLAFTPAAKAIQAAARICQWLGDIAALRRKRPLSNPWLCEASDGTLRLNA